MRGSIERNWEGLGGDAFVEAVGVEIIWRGSKATLCIKKKKKKNEIYLTVVW